MRTSQTWRATASSSRRGSRSGNWRKGPGPPRFATSGDRVDGSDKAPRRESAEFEIGSALRILQNLQLRPSERVSESALHLLLACRHQRADHVLERGFRD